MSNGVLLEPGDPKWQTALKSVPYDIYHTPAYLRLCASQYTDATPKGYVWEFENYTGIIPLIITSCPTEINESIGGGGYDGVSPYGYSGPILAHKDGNQVPTQVVQQFFDDFISDSRRDGLVAVFLRGHPFLSSACKPFDNDNSSDAGSTYGISLDRDVETVFSSYRNAFKRVIKKLNKVESLLLVWDRWDDIECFVPI